MPGPLLRVRVGDLVKVHLENALNSMRTHNIDFHFVMGSGGGAGALSVAPGEEGVLEARATAPGFYVFHCATPDIPIHIAKGMYGSVLVEPEEGLLAVGKSCASCKAKSIRTTISRDTSRSTRCERIRPTRSLQTTLIPTAGSAVVEFTPPVPGTFLLVDRAISRLHHGAAGSINVHGQENAEIFEPKTLQNMPPMSEDAHLGNGSHKIMPSARSTGDSGVHLAMAAQASEPKSANSVTIKMLPGSGIWKEGPMQTFGPNTVAIKAGMSVVFKNTDVSMPHSVFGKKANLPRRCWVWAPRLKNGSIRMAWWISSVRPTLG